MKWPNNQKPRANPFVLLPPSVVWFGNGTYLETNASLSNPNWIMSKNVAAALTRDFSLLLSATKGVCLRAAQLQFSAQFAVIRHLPAAISTFKDAQVQNEHLFLLVSPSVNFFFFPPAGNGLMLECWLPQGGSSLGGKHNEFLVANAIKDFLAWRDFFSSSLPFCQLTNRNTWANVWLIDGAVHHVFRRCFLPLLT